MLFMTAIEECKKDNNVLIYEINIAIDTVMNVENIATIGKGTRQRVINACLVKFSTGNYTVKDIENTVRRELY